MKKLLIILMMLTAFSSYSQDSIQITPNQARAAVKTAIKANALEVENNLLHLKIGNLETAFAAMQKKAKTEAAKFALLQENYKILETQLEAEKAVKKKPTWLRNALIIIGAFGGGVLAGSL